MLQRRLESQKQRRQRRLLLERSSGGNRSSRCRANYLPGLLIVLLVLLQNFELHMCRQLMGAAANRRKDMDTDEQLLPAAAAVASSMEKRAIAATTVSQPEEIFSAPNDAADMSYDEYPVSDASQRSLPCPASKMPSDSDWSTAWALVKPKMRLVLHTKFVIVYFLAFDCLPCRWIACFDIAKGPSPTLPCPCPCPYCAYTKFCSRSWRHIVWDGVQKQQQEKYLDKTVKSKNMYCGRWVNCVYAM